MEPTKQSVLLADLAAMRTAFIERIKRWPGITGQEEDVVQDAFARAVANASSLRDETQGDQWFFRVLKSAYVDYRRRTDARRRMLIDVANEVRVARQVVPEAPEVSCACLQRGLAALRPEYRKALEAVELGGRSLADLAATAGITPNNAGVRVHRARVALARLTRECCHGCRTTPEGCSCG